MFYPKNDILEKLVNILGYNILDEYLLFRINLPVILKQYREINNLTQIKLARLLNVSRSTIQDWEYKEYNISYKQFEKLKKKFIEIGLLSQYQKEPH